MLDQNFANVLIAFFALVNTGLLVYQATRLQSVHRAVDGAKDAAVATAAILGVTSGMAPPPRQKPPPPLDKTAAPGTQTGP
jgi:hypothetical protein